MSATWPAGQFSASWIAKAWTKCAPGEMPAVDAWVLATDGTTVEYRQYSTDGWTPKGGGRAEPLSTYTYWTDAPVLP
jgi:hypothetical protein